MSGVRKRSESCLRRCCRMVCSESVGNWRDLCDNTSMHGLKFIVSPTASILERCFWILVFVLGVFASGYYCCIMWDKWQNTPILVSFDTNDYPMKNIPFPAVTICGVNKVSKSKLTALLESPGLKNVSYKTMTQTLRYITRMDRAIAQEKDLDHLNRFLQQNSFTMKELVDILQITAPSCGDIILDCTWKNSPQPCMKYVSMRPTDDGICCTFNGGSYYDEELGINVTASENEPLRVSGHGYRTGLSLLLDSAIDDFSVTNGKYDGFKVLLHSADEFPNVADRGFVIGPGSVTYAGVKAVTSFHTDLVSDQIPKAKRHCVLSDEHKLDFFGSYSASACVIECATKIMVEKCKCRAYFFRAREEDTLCELDAFACISNVYEWVVELQDSLCHCPPTCSNIWYNPEISHAPFPGQGFFFSSTYERLTSNEQINSTKYETNYLRSNVGVLHVYYKEKTGDRYKVDIRYGLEDVISAMGGLLGFGFGFSVISIMEIIYFLCIRCCYRKKNSDFNSERNAVDCGSDPVQLADLVFSLSRPKLRSDLLNHEYCIEEININNSRF